MPDPAQPDSPPHPVAAPQSNGTSRWLTPGAMAAALCVGAALVLLNLAAPVSGAAHPWLVWLDLASDLAVLGIGAYLFVRMGIRAEARTARVQAALDVATARLASIVETAMDAVITIDDTHRIVLFNAAAETMFGCTRRSAIGDKIERFIPARFRAKHGGHIESFGRAGVTRRKMGEQATLWALHADGHEFPIEASISRTENGEQRYYTVILRDVTRRVATDDAMRQQQSELRELSARVLEAREEEKTLIARDLHDELGQLLTALKMDLAWLRERLPAELAEKAGKMNNLLDQTVGSVRRISAELRPLMLDDLGLADAAQWLVDDFSQRSGIPATLEQHGEFDGLDRQVATAIYRALQESLTNIARHAQARSAWVLLSIGDARVHLEVEDDGRGVAAGDAAKPRSLGLKGMRERALYLGGEFEVGRAPRGGTRVSIRIPVRAHEDAAT